MIPVGGKLYRKAYYSTPDGSEYLRISDVAGAGPQQKLYPDALPPESPSPSTQELFNIADYFNMSLSEFFDEENVESPTVQKAIDAIRKLSEQDAALALAMIQRLSLPLREGGAEQ